METTGMELRDRMVYTNRARTAKLRARMLARPGCILVAYADLRARGSEARDAIALVRACGVHHLKMWGESRNMRDGGAIVRDAMDRYRARLLESLPGIRGWSARAAWGNAYRQARLAAIEGVGHGW